MCGHMVPRGPDDGGVLTVSTVRGPVTVGSRRLAIVDPTPAGHQPMVDPATGATVVYNGMVYNYQALRRDLEARGHCFRSDCDTEVVLRAYLEFGSEFVRRLEGMFALAVVDPGAGGVLLARDRLGIKPLYHALDRAGNLVFASQVRALLQGLGTTPRVDATGLRSFLAFGAVREPETMIFGIEAVPPGSVLQWNAGSMRVTRYWEIGGRQLERPGTVEELQQRLGHAVASHLVADVPVGVFLSGGLDSSLVAALAARGHDICTFGVTFTVEEDVDGPWINRVVETLGTDHTRIPISPADALAALDPYFKAMDQPSFDGLNTYLVSAAAAQAGLKVALSGLGADELFDGYSIVARTRRLAAARRLWLLPLLTQVVRGDRREKLRRLAELPADVSHTHTILRALFADFVCPLPAAGCASQDGIVANVQQLELQTYLRDVLLRDTDAMSMAHSLEVRVPFLGDAVVSLALRTPAAGHLARKGLVRAAARSILPDDIIDRPKQGFALPFTTWLRGSLRDEVRERLLAPPEALACAVDCDFARNVWERFEESRTSWHRPWALYSLCRWCDELGLR